MNPLTHQQVHEWILNGALSPALPVEAELEAHLSACPACQAFARQVQEQSGLLKETMHARWDALAVPRQQPVTALDPSRRDKMARTGWSWTRSLAWGLSLIALVALLSWAIPRLALGQIFPDRPNFLSFLKQQVAQTAGEANVSAEDLGPGWEMTDERSDLEGDYYFDLNELGRPKIGTHTNPSPAWLDKNQVETVNMRGFAQADEHWVLMAVVGMFKDQAGAEAFASKFLPVLGRDSDIPAEFYTHETPAIGDEASMNILRQQEGQEIDMISLGFRKGRTILYMVTLGYPPEYMPNGNSPKALSVEQMLEIARKIEARLP